MKYDTAKKLKSMIFIIDYLEWNRYDNLQRCFIGNVKDFEALNPTHAMLKSARFNKL